MLYLLVGETSCGKDTIRRILEDVGGQAVVSYTTRPMHPGETNGVEHYFVSDAEANEILNKDKVAAYTEIGTIRYFVTKTEIEEADFYITDPADVQYLREQFPDLQTKVVYVTCDKVIAKERAKQRGDNMVVYEERTKNEEKQFKEFVAKHQYNAMLNNSGSLFELRCKVAEIFAEICMNGVICD